MKRRLFLVFTVAVFFGSLLTASDLGNTPKVESQDAALSRNLNVFNTITRYLAEYYVDSLRPDAAFETAIAGLLYTIDPYTEYYKADEVERLELMTTGAYGGIGAFVLSKDGNTYINLPIEGSPSYKAGLKGGDRIVRVDSVDVRGKTSDFTTKLLKGDPGTMVRVVVERPYVADSILTFDIMREKVQDKSVPYYGVSDGIAYIKLTSYHDKSAAEVREAMESFKNNPNVKGLVLDLRNNGGGLVTSAVEILGMVLPRGTKVLETKGKTDEAQTTYVTQNSPILPDMPIVVMINENTASAAEITAGALQDLDRAVLLGRRSFGKGLVQSTLSLPYEAYLKLTTAKYHLPSGRHIQALDYSHRRPDGSVAPTPDSLTHTFSTLNGRIVRDGGGLVPDTIVADKEFPRLVYNLLLTNQIFDYATKYVAFHPSIPSPGEFVIDDELFADFVAFVDTTKVKGDDTASRMIQELKKKAKADSLMSEQLEVTLDSVASIMKPDITRDLYNTRKEIEEELGVDIVGRYYSRAGEEEFRLRYDEEFDLARRILKEPDIYESLLSSDKTK